MYEWLPCISYHVVHTTPTRHHAHGITRHACLAPTTRQGAVLSTGSILGNNPSDNQGLHSPAGRAPHIFVMHHKPPPGAKLACFQAADAAAADAAGCRRQLASTVASFLLSAPRQPLPTYPPIITAHSVAVSAEPPRSHVPGPLSGVHKRQPTCIHTMRSDWFKQLLRRVTRGNDNIIRKRQKPPGVSSCCAGTTPAPSTPASAQLADGP